MKTIIPHLLDTISSFNTIFGVTNKAGTPATVSSRMENSTSAHNDDPTNGGSPKRRRVGDYHEEIAPSIASSSRLSSSLSSPLPYLLPISNVNHTVKVSDERMTGECLSSWSAELMASSSLHPSAYDNDGCHDMRILLTDPSLAAPIDDFLVGGDGGDHTRASRHTHLKEITTEEDSSLDGLLPPEWPLRGSSSSSSNRWWSIIGGMGTYGHGQWHNVHSVHDNKLRHVIRNVLLMKETLANLWSVCISLRQQIA
jgi:hypothetical protein